MLQSIKLFGTVFILMTILFSCKKENALIKEELKIVTLAVQIEAGKIYGLDLNAYANANDIILIAKQAIVFDVSEIKKNELKNVYNFKRNIDNKDGAMKENVVLKIYEPRNGIHCEKTEIIIHFTII
jgi:hypothetical protein